MINGQVLPQFYPEKWGHYASFHTLSTLSLTLDILHPLKWLSAMFTITSQVEVVFIKLLDS